MIKLIIADGHQITREEIKIILKKESDFKVIAEAQNAIELLQKIQSYDCDILLLDIDMANRKGNEMINELKLNKPQIQILAISKHPEDQQALNILRSGASGYICKNSGFGELIVAIQRIYAHGRYLSETLTDQLAYNVMSVKNNKLHEQLSARELETLVMLVSGKNVKDIAKELSLSKSTVFTYRGRIFNKLEINSNLELMRYAEANELVEFINVVA